MWLEKRRKKWCVAWRDDSGIVRRKTAYSDKGASRAMMLTMEKAVARGEQDLVDQFAPHRNRALAEHVADYLAELKTLGRSAKYQQNIGNRLNKLMKACGWEYLRNITADSFCNWRDTIEVGEDGLPTIGPVTQNQYLEAAFSFCGWCVRRRRMALNPLVGVPKAEEVSDIRRERRALTAEQAQSLLSNVKPEYRAVYRFMLATGLRRNETAQLVWGDVALNSPTPFLRLRAKTTKARRADTLPIHPDIAAELRAMRGEAGDGERVFWRVPSIYIHKKFLAAAGIPWEDDEGRRADIHALRHTFGTSLSQNGVSPRVAMELMRHTDLRLTMKLYTDPRIFDLAGAVSKIAIPSVPAELRASA